MNMDRLPLVCGIDEVGRGSLAGPLISVATLFRGYATGVEGVDDSKKLSPAKRSRIFKELLWSPFLAGFGIGEVSAEEINDIGIDEANAVSFIRAVERLPEAPSYIIIDGRDALRGWDPIFMSAEPQADGKYPIVGAASILAKVIRDSYMVELSEMYPGYAWERNKGYGTAAHTEGLEQLGPTKFHRTKFIRNISFHHTGVPNA